MGRRLTDEERALREVTEKAFQSRVVELARLYGWRVAHFHDSRRQVKPGVFVGDKDAAGFPDLVLVRPPDEWLSLLVACGVEARVVRPSDWDWVRARLVGRVADATG